MCGGERCQRQHPVTAVQVSAHAHVNFAVPQSIDEALEEVCLSFLMIFFSCEICILVC